MANSVSEPGRRERNKQDKQDRIFTAAAELFAQHGYAAVTTQQIADRADVAIGTLFRYAATKAELLLMVYNERYREAIARGRELAEATTGSATRITALITPLLHASIRNSENTGVYQREVLFGDPTERYRAEGLLISQQLQGHVSGILDEDGPPGSPTATPAVSTAARTIADVVHLEIARTALAHPSAEGVLALVTAQIELIVAGLHATHGPSTPGTSRRRPRTINSASEGPS